MDKKKILLVDDEVDLVDILKMRLEASNYQVVTAYDGEQALEKAKSEKPDLVILDILLPKKDGYHVAREMKADEAMRNIPVIILSAKSKMQDLFKIEGLSDYLVKPFEAEELLKKIKKYLQ